ncbi:IS66 family insertion sequence element accessory protein TnpA [Leptospira alstonii]
MIREWKEIGLSESKFCTSRNLSFKAFDHWMRKLS